MVNLPCVLFMYFQTLGFNSGSVTFQLGHSLFFDYFVNGN